MPDEPPDITTIPVKGPEVAPEETESRARGAAETLPRIPRRLTGGVLPSGTGVPLAVFAVLCFFTALFVLHLEDSSYGPDLAAVAATLVSDNPGRLPDRIERRLGQAQEIATGKPSAAAGDRNGQPPGDDIEIIHAAGSGDSAEKALLACVESPDPGLPSGDEPGPHSVPSLGAVSGRGLTCLKNWADATVLDVSAHIRGLFWYRTALIAREQQKAGQRLKDNVKEEVLRLERAQRDAAENVQRLAVQEEIVAKTLEMPAAIRAALDEVSATLGSQHRQGKNLRPNLFESVTRAFELQFGRIDFASCRFMGTPPADLGVTLKVLIMPNGVMRVPTTSTLPIESRELGKCATQLFEGKTLNFDNPTLETVHAKVTVNGKGAASLKPYEEEAETNWTVRDRNVIEASTRAYQNARDLIGSVSSRLDSMKASLLEQAKDLADEKARQDALVESAALAIAKTSPLEIDDHIRLATSFLETYLANAGRDTANTQVLTMAAELAARDAPDRPMLSALFKERRRAVLIRRIAAILLPAALATSFALFLRQAFRHGRRMRRLHKAFVAPVRLATLLDILRDEKGSVRRLGEAMAYAQDRGRGDLLLLTETLHDVARADPIEPADLDRLTSFPPEVLVVCPECPAFQKLGAFLSAALSVRTVSGLTKMAEPIAELQASYADLAWAGFPYLDGVLSGLASTVDGAARHQRGLGGGPGATFLNAAAGFLNEASQAVNRTTTGLERRAFLRVIAVWNSVIQRALEDLQGIAQLEASFPSLNLPYAGTVLLDVEVHNHGQGFAEAISCALVTDDLQADEAQIPLGALLPGSAVKIHFRLHPPGIGSYPVAVRLTFDDIRRTRETVEFVETLSVREGPERPFVRMPRNPYIVGAPVRDRSMFFGREAVLEQLVEALDAGAQTNAIIIYGQRRMGKTSLLYQLQGHLDPGRFSAVLMDAQGMQPPTTDRFYHLMLSCAASAAVERGVAYKTPDLSEFLAHPDEAFERHFRELKKAMDAAGFGGRRIVLMIDEFEYLQSLIRSGTVDAGVLAYVRHLVQHEPALAFVFAGSHAIEELAAQYWSDLYGLGVHFRIGFLSEAETRELLMRPTKDFFDFDNAALDRVYDLTRGQPFLTQALASRVVSFRNRRSLTRITRDHVDQVATEFLARGPAEVRTYWEESPPLQRMCLTAVATLVRQRGRCTYGEIRQLLDGYRVPTGDLPSAVETLTRRELLVSDEHEGLGISMAVLSEWIHRNQSLERLVG